MDDLHTDFVQAKSVFEIDSPFRNELLAVASRVGLLTPQSLQPKPERPQAYPLLDLPNEILLYILEHIESIESLYSISKLSRRLHHLALPLYLARHGISPFSGSLVLFDDVAPDILHALSTALFRPTLRCVSCTFNFCWPNRTVLRHTRALSHLLPQLASLHEAHLDFTNTHSFASREPDFNNSERFAANDLSQEAHSLHKVDRAQEISGLLEGVVAAGCRTLTVCLAGWTTLSSADEIREVLSPSRLLYPSNLWRLLAGGAQALFDAVQSPKGITWLRPTVEKPPEVLALETFNVHSSMLLHKQFCGWTVRTLNRASLSTLSLRNLDVYINTWGVILPCLTLPHLTSLTVDRCSLMYPDLAQFLARHPHIQRLYLGRSLHAPLPTEQKNNNTEEVRNKDVYLHSLNLTHLSAAPAYLRYLLAASGALPKLREVTIIARVHYRRHFDFAAMNEVLAGIVGSRVNAATCIGASAPSGPRNIHLALDLSLESSSADWMRLELHSPASPPASPALTHISPTFPKGTSEGVLPYQSPSWTSPPSPPQMPPPAPVPTQGTNCIARLELRVAQYTLPEAMLARLPRWLASFPALRELVLRTPGAVGMNVVQRGPFVRAVFGCCRGLEKVEIDGQALRKESQLEAAGIQLGTPSKGEYVVQATREFLQVLETVADGIPIPGVGTAVKTATKLIQACDESHARLKRAEDLKLRIKMLVAVLVDATKGKKAEEIQEKLKESILALED
ncbi:hypothetical protein H0H81_009070 [Sphagnurus paluster]|uniref:F-box domain-containing protein n=1 Tax=Sphagnurus paluster TaxID=117069 RepID=A0A9P7KL92_9AGAR|nr:hypothetical protein H0H81_009070 [Sphagnurus paluster]